MAILKPLVFSDGQVIRNMRELKDSYSEHEEEIKKFIVGGQLTKFLDGKDDDSKKLIEEGLNNKKSLSDIYKELAAALDIVVDVNSVQNIIIVRPDNRLKEALETSDKGVNFPIGSWEESELIRINSANNISGMGKNDTVLKISEIIINIPQNMELVIGELFFQSCVEDAKIIVEGGKVIFQEVNFERVRLIASKKGSAKTENCEFMLLTQTAITEIDDGKIDYDESTKFTKCKTPYSYPEKKKDEISENKELADNAQEPIEDGNAEVKQYRKAAKDGDADAQYKLGVCYSEEGSGLEVDYKEAMKWYRKAAEQGHAKAMYSLADFFENGYGVVEVDKAEAVKWLRKAAEGEHMDAQYKMADFLENGRGVMKVNKAEAVKWYRKAAEQGHAEAQYKMGDFLENGHGVVAANKTEAAKWYRKAADQRYAEASCKLGKYYADRLEPDRYDDIDRDNFDQAVKWYNIAAQQGHKMASYYRDKLEEAYQGKYVDYFD